MSSNIYGIDPINLLGLPTDTLAALMGKTPPPLKPPGPLVPAEPYFGIGAPPLAIPASIPTSIGSGREPDISADLPALPVPSGSVGVAQPAVAPPPRPATPTLEQLLAAFAPQRNDAGYGAQLRGIANQYAANANASLGDMRRMANDRAELANMMAGDRASYAQRANQVEALAAEEAKKSAEAIAAQRASYEQAQNDAKIEIDGIMADYKKSAEIDPERLAKNRTTSGEVMAAIGLMLGGIGSAISGGPNLAFQTLQNKINNDIQAQVDKRNGLRDLISEKRAQLGDERAKHMSIVDLLQLEQAQKMASYSAQLRGIAKASEGTQEGYAAQLLANDADMKLAEYGAGIAKNIADTKTRAIVDSAAIDDQRMSRDAAMSAADAKNGIALPNSVVAIGPMTKESAKAISDKTAAYNEFIGYIDSAVDLRKKFGQTGKWLNDADRAMALELMQAVIRAGRGFYGSGASMTEAETELAAIKDPASLSFSLYDKVLNQLVARQKSTNQGYDAFLDAHNGKRRSVVDKDDAMSAGAVRR